MSKSYSKLNLARTLIWTSAAMLHGSGVRKWSNLTETGTKSGDRKSKRGPKRGVPSSTTIPGNS